MAVSRRDGFGLRADVHVSGCPLTPPQAKTEGRADNKLVSDTVKSKLQPAAKK